MIFKYCKKCYDIRQFVEGNTAAELSDEPKHCDVCGGDE